LDALEVLRKAEELGGSDRKRALLDVLRTARKHGCDYSPGGGKLGGFNIRYGSLKFAIMDVNTEGTLFLHIKPHPGKPISEEYRDEANEYIASLDGITIKNGPIHHYGQVEAEVEKIPAESIERFIVYAVERIQSEYYQQQAT
jgi:hypothetical protein